MAAALVAMQGIGLKLQQVPPLRFVICMGAAISRHPRHVAAISSEARVQCPSCHIIGHADWIKVREGSGLLPDPVSHRYSIAWRQRMKPVQPACSAACAMHLLMCGSRVPSLPRHSRLLTSCPGSPS